MASVFWKSRIKDQGSVENISNKLPLRDSEHWAYVTRMLEEE